MEKTINQQLEYISRTIKDYNLKKKISGTNFSVFRVFGVLHDELAWSAWIAYLLDSNAEHNYEDKFLRLFLKRLHMETFFDMLSVKVSVEFSIGELDKKSYEKGGRIDILIAEGKKKAIIIENKLFAQDQPKQLYRYNNFAKDEKKGFADYRILYLTRLGSAPSEDSTNGITNFERISYIDTIKLWLHDCLNICEKGSRISDFIEQTIAAIDEICKQTIVDDEIKTAVENNLDLQNKNPSQKIKELKKIDYSNYADVEEQCLNLIKQYQQEQFSEIINEAGIDAEVFPFEGILDGYWHRKAKVLNNDEIDSIFVMHEWIDKNNGNLYCGIQFKTTESKIYHKLLSDKVLFEDPNNHLTIMWHEIGLTNFETLYEHLVLALRFLK